MSDISITYDGAPLGYDVPPTKINMPQRAELGSTSTGGFSPEDPSAGLTLTGWRPISIDENDCTTQPRLFTGYVFIRKSGRSFEQTQFVGPDARVHDTDLVDLNAVFSMRIISGADGKRPSETMDARMAWILSSDYLAGTPGTLIEDTGHVLTGLTRPMDAADYRGGYPDAVFQDLASRSQDAFNWFAFWDPAPVSGSPRPGLFFDYVGAAVMDSTISISNVASDLSSTCFEPDHPSRLERTPETVYSDVILTYKGGGEVVRNAAATEAAFVKRGTKIDRPYTGQQSTAISQADDYLAAHSKETDRITTTIHAPSSAVGLLWAGQRMQARFSHLPGYETAVWMRIVASNPRAVDDLAQWYDVDLELVAPQIAVNPCEGSTPTAFYPPIGEVGGHVGDTSSAQADATGNVYYARVGGTMPYVPSPGFIGDWFFPVWRTTATFPLGWGDYSQGWPANCVGMPVVGGGTATIYVDGRWNEFGDPQMRVIVDHNLEITHDSDTGWVDIHGYQTFVVTVPGIESGVCNHRITLYFQVPGAHIIYSGFGGFDWVADGLATTGAIIPTVQSIITTTDPTVTDDETHGYAVGSKWINTTTGQEYVLVDSTTGAATWVSTTAVSVFSFSTTDGVTTVDPTTSLTFVGATITDLGGGDAELTFSGSEVLSTIAALGATHTLDLAAGNVFDATLTADCTLTFTGATGGVPCSFVLLLRQDGTGGWVTAWPGSVVWPGGTAPTLDTTLSTLSEFVFETIDGGTTWLGHAVGAGGATGAASGDLSGTYPGPTVAKINGVAVTGTPSIGMVPTATSSSAATWQAPATSSGGEILVTDTPAGSPLIFADLLQNEAGTDLLYAG